MRITGQWKIDNSKVAKALYRNSGAPKAIESAGKRVADRAADNLIRAGEKPQMDIAGLPGVRSMPRFKDTKPFSSPKAAGYAGSKGAEAITVGLVVVDRFDAQKLESKTGFLSDAGAAEGRRKGHTWYEAETKGSG